MKNYMAVPGSKVTLESNGELSTVELYSREGLDMLSNLWFKTAVEHRLNYEPTWLGRSIIQLPTDIVAMQELLWKVQPDVVVETGVAHGGSLVLSASILELIGKGKVIGVDIEIRPHNRAAIEAHPLKKRIELVEGSSVAPKTLQAVRELIGDAKMVLVAFDSNHSHAYVLQEMKLYGPLVTPGSYMVVADGSQEWVWEIPRGKAEWKGNGPLEAIDEFLAVHNEFVIDPHYTRHAITCSPRGYLRRLTPAELKSG